MEVAFSLDIILTDRTKGNVINENSQFMKHLIPCIFVIFSFSCCRQGSVSEYDSKTYQELAKGFYLGSDHKMYIWTTADDGKEGCRGAPFFREVPVVDVASFENLGQEGWYAKDRKNIYIDHLMTDGRHIWVLDSADAGSFQSIGYRWGKDNKHVFENGIILEGLHPDSMIILCPETKENKQVFFDMVKDKKHVFYGNEEMAGVDALTFECIKSGSSIFYRDKNWIYNENYFPNREGKNKVRR